jgi:UDP-glucose 4-epimerase
MVILVIGGLNGFVGSNTTEALVEQGFDCVVTSHRDAEAPQFLKKHLNHHVFVEKADATSVSDLRLIGEKHKIDGIVDVAGGLVPQTDSPTPQLKAYFDMLVSVFQAAEEWRVKRVLMSSTGGMYFGLSGTVNEDSPIQLPSPFGLIAHHKIVEVSMAEFAKGGISTVCVRLLGMFGPGHDQAVLPQRLVHAAVSGKPANLEGIPFGKSDDSIDMMYIKDVARAIALLQAAEKLPHNVYNVCSGRATSSRQIADAVEKAVPGFKVDLQEGRSPFPPLPPVSAERLKADTGFTPRFDIQSAIQDYVDWVREGNPK